MASYYPQNRFPPPGNNHYNLNTQADIHDQTYGGPFPLDESDLAKLDADISRPHFELKPRYDQRDDYDKENNWLSKNPNHNNAHPTSDGYYQTPVGLRRTTSDIARNRIITPPTSSSPHVDEMKFYQQQQPYAMQQQQFQAPPTPYKYEQRQPLANIENLQQPRYQLNSSFAKSERDRIIEDMQRICEERIDIIKKTEAEKAAMLEADYKRQLSKLRFDLETVLRKQEEVHKLKNTVDQSLQKDLDKAKHDLRKERELRKNEKERLEERIRELENKIDQLSKKLKYSPILSDQPLTVSNRNKLLRDYETKISDLQHEHDEKISELIKQFEREKHSTMQILKTRIKSEISLLVPRIRQQCQDAFNQALLRSQEQTAQKYKERYSSVIKKLKEEHQAEKKFIQKQAREEIAAEKVAFEKRLKAKYEMKAMQIKNDCERRLLERLKGRGESAGNVSFASDLLTISEGASDFEDNDSFVYKY